MANLIYTIIKTDKQYSEYCNILEKLVSSGLENQEIIDEYELLHLLIKDWDDKYQLGPDLDPVELVKSFMDDHGLNQTELADIAGIGKSYISEILNYKKRMSKKVIRNIANHFKIQQEALNKPYRLEGERTEDQSKGVSELYVLNTENMIQYEERDAESHQVVDQRQLAYA